MQQRISTSEMLKTNINLHGRPLTDRQRRALLKRARRNKRAHRECIGCYSGLVPWNQGSDYCTRCLKNG